MQDFIGGGCCRKEGDGPAGGGAKLLASLLLLLMINGAWGGGGGRKPLWCPIDPIPAAVIVKLANEDWAESPPSLSGSHSNFGFSKNL